MADDVKNDDVNEVTGRRFVDMDFSEKLRFIGKVCVFLVSAGFAFPNIFSE